MRKCVLIFCLSFLVGCGTLLHPERRNQPYGTRLDPTIVALDALGVVCFVIPGLIAFAIDASNGTMYLPPEGQGHQVQASSSPIQKMDRVPEDWRAISNRRD